MLARSALVPLRNEISSKEKDLARLTDELARLTGLAGERVTKALTGTTKAAAAPKAKRRGGRTDWSEVLSSLPREFKASDVRKIGSAADKRASEIFAAITRWIDGGSVKRKARGVYQRVK
jgi:hypothetical protein